MLTGVQLIDHQHDEILKIAEQLKKIAHEGSAQQLISLPKGFHKLIEKVHEHFEFEERLMEQVDYAYLKVHKRLHEHFSHRCYAYMVKLDNGEPVGLEFADYVVNWLRNHFKFEDKDYVPNMQKDLQGSSGPEKDGWLSRLLKKSS